MSRSLVLGNGNILLCFDKFAQLRDFYFPYAGLENHIGFGNSHKIGVWVDGKFSWLSDDSWKISIDYEKETMTSNISAENEHLGLTVGFLDVVYNERNIFLRNVKVKNKNGGECDVRVFFNQQLQISETTHADTVYYNPNVRAIIHYKGRRVFLIGGQLNGNFFEEYSTGIFRIEGKEGTWKDAEDGLLSKNPIEHGSVDSTIGFRLNLKGGEEQTVNYWIAVGETFGEVSNLQDYIVSKTPTHLAKSTQDFWHAWVNKYNFTFFGLDDDVVELFKKSLFIIRTHCDNNGGILASGDSDNFRYGRDTYAYIWPRDAAFLAMALDRCGYFDLSYRFYDFCSQVITEDGYLLHKYHPDKSYGSSWHPWVSGGKGQLPIQEDETALILFGLWEHYEKNRDLEFIEKLYNPFIKKAADFMASYRDGFVTGLPYLSYDLWEEKNGISTFTAASVYGALNTAAKFSSVLGKDNEAQYYRGEAEKIKEAILEHLYNKENGYFYKLLSIKDGKVEKDPTLDISSLYGMFRFGVLFPDDPVMIKASQVAQAELHSKIPIGGYARYARDQYYEMTSDVPGNPWFITTLWMIQYKIALAKNEAELRGVNEALKWAVKYALTSGIMSEQIHPFTGEQLSVSPLTWSHGEFVTTVIDYLEKLEKLGICSVCYPLKRN